MVSGAVMEFEVEQGNAIDIVWDLPGAEETPGDNINVDVMTSSLTLTFPDGFVQVLRLMRDVVIQRQWPSMKVSALLRKDDTSDWPIGDIGYVANFLLKDGTVSNHDVGTISVLPLTGKVKAKPVRPWSLLNPLEMRASAEEQAERLSVCKGCPSLKKGVCVECGCVMKVKSRLARATCPKGLWGMSENPVPNEDVDAFNMERERVFSEWFPEDAS
jgi:hypothetical protein